MEQRDSVCHRRRADRRRLAELRAGGRGRRPSGRPRRPDVLARAAHERRADHCVRETMTALPTPVARLLDFLGALGPRWGLPEAPCRVHGYLYLSARALSEADIADAAAGRRMRNLHG